MLTYSQTQAFVSIIDQVDEGDVHSWAASRALTGLFWADRDFGTKETIMGDVDEVIDALEKFKERVGRLLSEQQP